jgi:hypothetical protein
MEEIPYKGYLIEATPDQLADLMKWTLHLYIFRHSGGGVRSKDFSARNIFDTEEEAAAACVDFGKRIIDGEIEGCTVDDL